MATAPVTATWQHTADQVRAKKKKKKHLIAHIDASEIQPLLLINLPTPCSNAWRFIASCVIALFMCCFVSPPQLTALPTMETTQKTSKGDSLVLRPPYTAMWISPTSSLRLRRSTTPTFATRAQEETRRARTSPYRTPPRSSFRPTLKTRPQPVAVQPSPRIYPAGSSRPTCRR